MMRRMNLRIDNVLNNNIFQLDQELTQCKEQINYQTNSKKNEIIFSLYAQPYIYIYYCRL